MRRLMVVICVTFVGCAASQYKFACNGGVCDVETAGPATLDFEREFGETLEVVEAKDGQVTMRVDSQRKTFKQLESGSLGKLQIKVKNTKGENAFFDVSE